jgi:hypothetical protein
MFRAQPSSTLCRLVHPLCELPVLRGCRSAPFFRIDGLQRGCIATHKFDDPNLPGEIQTTITLKNVSVGTEVSIVQEGEAGWYSVISLHGGGSLEAMKREIWRNYPIADRRAVVEHLLDRGVLDEGRRLSRQPGRCCAAGCEVPAALPAIAE